MSSSDLRPYRGNYPLPDSSREKGYDTDAERLLAHPGHPMVARPAGDADGYVVYSPCSRTVEWRRFTTLEELRAWAAAYGVSVDDITTDKLYSMRAPVDASGFAALHLRAR